MVRGSYHMLADKLRVGWHPQYRARLATVTRSAKEKINVDTWNERPQDVFNLLNPSFVGLLFYRAVRGFKRETTTGMPFELIFWFCPLSCMGLREIVFPQK